LRNAGNRFPEELVGQRRSIHFANRAVDGERHSSLYRFHVELVFLAAVTDNLQFHRIFPVG
jgi:hypothetical protein